MNEEKKQDRFAFGIKNQDLFLEYRNLAHNFTIELNFKA